MRITEVGSNSSILEWFTPAVIVLKAPIINERDVSTSTSSGVIGQKGDIFDGVGTAFGAASELRPEKFTAL
jgi:hypothetical protein